MLHGVMVLCRQTGGLFYSKVGFTCFPRGNESPVGAAAGVISRHSPNSTPKFHARILGWLTSRIEKKMAEEAAVAELLLVDNGVVFVRSRHAARTLSLTTSNHFPGIYQELWPASVVRFGFAQPRLPHLCPPAQRLCSRWPIKRCCYQPESGAWIFRHAFAQAGGNARAARHV